MPMYLGITVTGRYKEGSVEEPLFLRTGMTQATVHDIGTHF